jgi:CheY-like chemotaxis protein
MQILLVDDSATARLAARWALAKNLPGADIAEAASGEEAKAWLKVHEADLIVCDLEMEPCDGIEVVQWLRRQPAFKHTQVIIYSGFVDVLVKAVLHKHQPISYLAKPATTSQVRQALQGVGQAAQALHAA